MAARVLTGVEELDSVLVKLSVSSANKIAKFALRAGVITVASEVKKVAPAGETKALRRSIGSRVQVKGRGDFVVGKVGVNVGKQRKQSTRTRAPHSHLIALGTKPRYRKRIGGKYAYIRKPRQDQLRTGIVAANPFVKVGYNNARGLLPSIMTAAAKKALLSEIDRIVDRKFRTS